MDQFKKSINKSIKVLVEEIFTFCEGKIKENEEKINSLENTITNHEEELKAAASSLMSCLLSPAAGVVADT